MRMYTNDANAKLIYPELSYRINGVLFKAHNIIGRFGRESQYCDLAAKLFTEEKILFEREYVVADTGNRLDFFIEGIIIFEAKAKPVLTLEDYYQMQRYLQILDVKLGILVNFRQQYLHPKRILRTKKGLEDREKF